MIRAFPLQQFVLFLGVCATAAAVNWLARILRSRWLPFAVAVLPVYLVGMLVEFFLNRVYVFPTSRHPILLLVRDFVLTNLAFFSLVWLASVIPNATLISFGN